MLIQKLQAHKSRIAKILITIIFKFKQILCFTIYFNAHFFTVEQGRINSYLTGGVHISSEGVVTLVRLVIRLRLYSATIVGSDLVISRTKL